MLVETVEQLSCLVEDHMLLSGKLNVEPKGPLKNWLFGQCACKMWMVSKTGGSNVSKKISFFWFSIYNCKRTKV